MSEPENVTLAREAAAAGLIVTYLMPATCGTAYAIQLWEPDGTLWAEGRHESPPMIRAHIAHWPVHRQALAERTGLRLVDPRSGQALACGCLANTTKEEA